MDIMDMNNTTRFQTTEDTNNEMEYDIMEWYRCSFISQHLTIFLVGGIGISFVSLIGIVGNILCAIVLSRPTMRTSTNIILFGLSVYDSIFVFMALLVYGIPWFIQYFCVDSFESFYLTKFYPIKITYFRPFIYIAQLGSTYFTVLVTMERFFVVYRPLMARPYCTNKNAIRVSLAIAAFTILFTMPVWWEIKIESVYDENGNWTKYQILPSLRKNENYILYYGWVYLIVYRIIPVILLTLLNISIYWKIRKASKMRESMTHVLSSEISVAKMLIWIVSIFLLCNLWNLYFNVMRMFGSSGDSAELEAVQWFLYSLNSAVNFIIYSLKSNKFRLVFMHLFWLNNLKARWSNNSPR